MLGNRLTAADADERDSTQRGGSRTRVTPAKGMFVCSAAYRDKAGLYLLDGDGKVAEELVRPAPGERLGHFAVSPDARWVIYTRYVSRRPDRDPYPTLCAVPAAGGDTNELKGWDPVYETCYQNPVFSPTGEKVVCEFGLRGAYNPDLQVLELHESDERLHGWATGLSIINPIRIGNHAPQFMADGERIVYFGNFAHEDLLEVCLYDPAVADEELLGAVGWRLTENADGVWHRPRAIAVQPEWEQIFFIQGHMGNAERIRVLLLADLPPGGHRKVFDTFGREHERIGALAMSPDGLRLAYDGDGVIHLIAADGGNLRRVSPDGMDCRCPHFSEDGARLAYVGNHQLCVADVEAGMTVVTAAGGDELRIGGFVWA
jgi:Tol biopolymer transport system component